MVRFLKLEPGIGMCLDKWVDHLVACISNWSSGLKSWFCFWCSFCWCWEIIILMMIQVLRSLPCMWKTWKECQGSSFGLVQSWLWQHSGTESWDRSYLTCSLSLSVKLEHTSVAPTKLKTQIPKSHTGISDPAGFCLFCFVFGWGRFENLHHQVPRWW